VSRTCRLLCGAFFALSAGRGTGLRGQVSPGTDSAPGGANFPISCSPSAQTEFNRATALLHHMTYPRAREGFERVAAIDRGCAMAHWGIAMTLFQPLWPTRPGPPELTRGWAEVEKARQPGRSTERERLFIEAAAAFFEDPASTDYWARIRRWEAAMSRVQRTFPHDDEAAAFYALALLALPVSQPDSGRAHSERAADLLMAVYRRNPHHPGAMHYLVHANDAAGREHDSLAIVRKYETTAPRNPHALHMPTHIYTRLGDWNGSIRGNLMAAAAALEHPAGDHGQYVWDEFPHAIEYLVYAYLQKGMDDSAGAQLRRIETTTGLEPTFKTAFHLASTRARFALERHAWREARSLPPRDPPLLSWDRFAWPEAVAWFARGLGAIHEGNREEARQAITRIKDLESVAERAGESLFARQIRILGLEVAAWVASAEGNASGSTTLMREAIALEEATPKPAVTPAPTIPAQELLGDLLMQQGKPDEALTAYQRSLELYPGRFNSLMGGARAAKAGGNASVARSLYRALLEVAGEGTRLSALEEARRFVE